MSRNGAGECHLFDRTSAKYTAILADNFTGLELINAFIVQKELKKQANIIK
ncbi:hypothetical protein [Legionella birminghamensis]|uniref:hypothetical protein n=1 Tax=Legionella birminghamensis TaxID=28083 RepID=UPI000A3ED197|nr:hypothetical protein [Legionella birminghamensis]